jgi:predicted double-glycine peptidase
MTIQTSAPYILFIFTLVLTGCSPVYSPLDANINDQGKIVTIEYIKQLESYSCGAASLEMVSSYWGKKIRQQDLIDSANETIKETGFSLGELKANALENGLKAISFSGSRQILEAQISKGRPVIVALSLPYNRSVQSPFFRSFPASKGAAFFMDSYSHYVVVLGITPQDIIVMDPLTGIDTYSYTEFDKHWSERSYGALLITV